MLCVKGKIRLKTLWLLKKHPALAEEEDFQPTIQRVYHSRRHPSLLKVRVMDNE